MLISDWSILGAIILSKVSVLQGGECFLLVAQDVLELLLGTFSNRGLLLLCTIIRVLVIIVNLIGVEELVDTAFLVDLLGKFKSLKIDSVSRVVIEELLSLTCDEFHLGVADGDVLLDILELLSSRDVLNKLLSLNDVTPIDQGFCELFQILGLLLELLRGAWRLDLYRTKLPDGSKVQLIRLSLGLIPLLLILVLFSSHISEHGLRFFLMLSHSFDDSILKILFNLCLISFNFAAFLFLLS